MFYITITHPTNYIDYNNGTIYDNNEQYIHIQLKSYIHRVIFDYCCPDYNIRVYDYSQYVATGNHHQAHQSTPRQHDANNLSEQQNPK